MRRYFVALAVALGCASPGSHPAVGDAGFDIGAAPLDQPVARDTGVPGVPDVAVDGPLEARDTGSVSPSRTVLRVRYPGRGRSIALRGDLGGVLDWQRGVAFRVVGEDVFEWSGEAVNAAFEWKPLLDDRTWSRGPNYRATPGATVEVYPRFEAGGGRYFRWQTALRSTVLGNTRGVWVYLPPSYEENTSSRYPVVYMHDGQNLFDPRAAFGAVAWNADGALNAGAEDASVREAIVVGPENNAARVDEYTPTLDATRMAGGRGDLYLRFLVEELKPLVDRTFRTMPSRDHTALVGSSLGGLISSYAGVRRAEVFGLIGALSPSTWWDARVILREVATVPTRPQRPLRVYIDSGDSGPSMDDLENTRMHAAAWRSAGYTDDRDLRYVVGRGAAHNEAAWAQRLPGAFRFLLGPRAP